VSIPSGDLDPDSPITTELMTALYENALFNNEWLGVRANAQTQHAHQGTAVDGTAPVDYSDLGGTFPGLLGVDVSYATNSEAEGDRTEFETAAVFYYTTKMLLIFGTVLYDLEDPGLPVTHDKYGTGFSAATMATSAGRCTHWGTWDQGEPTWHGGDQDIAAACVGFESYQNSKLDCTSLGGGGTKAKFKWDAAVGTSIPLTITRETRLTVVQVY
jgi:hypothetical protein